MSVQIRTYHEVCSAANESRRFVQEAQALLSLDHQIMQRQYGTLHGQQVQTCRREVVTRLPAENALGLTADGEPVSANGRLDGAVGEGGNDDAGGGYLTPPPAYRPSVLSPPMMAVSLSTMGKLTGSGSGSGRTSPTSSMLLMGCLSDATGSAVSAPPTPTPTQSTFAVEETKIRTTRTTTTKTETMATVPASPRMIRALREMHRAQDSVDAAADDAALRGTLAGALDAHNDVDMVRCLQVSRGEIPEAAETLRRMLGVGGVGVDENANERLALERGEHGADMGNTELDRKFMQTGIEAMMRLTSVVAKQPRNEVEQRRLGEGAGTVGAPELPSWTITRYVIVIPTCTLTDSRTHAWWTDTRLFERARLAWGSFRTCTSVTGEKSPSSSRCWHTVFRERHLCAMLSCGMRSIIRTYCRCMVRVVRWGRSRGSS
jgi:hypothetical protein